MAANYRLGLDVGTASAGVAAIALNRANEPVSLAWHHVRIFNEPLEQSAQGQLASKKAARRKARMQRRQTDRRNARLRRIAHLGRLIGLNPEIMPPDDGNHLPKLRAQAAVARVELDDLLRILLRLSKRRGYKGEFTVKKKGPVAEGSSELDHAMKALATERGVAEITLGQYLLHRLENGLPARLKIRESGEVEKGKKDEVDASNVPENLYALRSMVEKEFDTIWKTQSTFHEVLKAEHDGKSMRDHFHEALFYQRPLKSAAGLVEQCGLEPTLPRAPRAQMAFQRFRIEKTLTDLRWGAGKHAASLSPKQKTVIRELLDCNERVKFEDIYKALEQAGCAKPQGKGLNLERASREELPGNSTLAALRRLDKHSRKDHPERAANLEHAFRALEEKTQISVINFLAELGSPEQLDDPEWHTCFVKRDGTLRRFSEPLVTFVNQIKEHDKFDRLSKMDFDGGRASYSVKALNKLADWLHEPNWPGDWQGDMSRIDEEAAVRACYPLSLNRDIKHMGRLPAPKPTGNAVVDGALRQIYWLINKMIAELGAQPDEIVVEMAREMSLGIARRNEREKENTLQQKARREAEKEICTHGLTPTSGKIRRYLLWAEQDKSFCPYCNRTIGITEALSGAATEYEHILPKKLTQIGMKRSEIALAHYACNQEKGDRTPWEAWGEGRNDARWQSVEAAAARFEKKKRYRKAKLLRLKDFEREVLSDESINEFADRQFHQTSWIAKEAAQWLQCLCPNKVSVSRGQLTSMLRRKWGLDTVIPEVRIENNLPVLDEEGKPILPEDFAKLRKYLEGHPVMREEREANPGFDFNRRPDKRLDHRHHLIDAITLALTSRDLFQKMARDYKQAAETFVPRAGEATDERERRLKRQTRLRLEVPEPPLRDVRVQALAAVRECRISIKPDRYPDGALFKDTAYGVGQREGEDKLRLTLRQSVVDLGRDSKGKTTEASARKGIASIVSEEIRNLVSRVFAARLAQGRTAAESMAEPMLHPGYGTLIRKVKCFAGYAEDAQPIVFTSRRGEHRKYLVNAGYAYLDLMPDGSKEPNLVKIRDALRDKGIPKPQGALRICKGDVVVDAKDGQLYRICLFKAAGTIAMLPIWEPRSFKQANEKAKRGCKVGGAISFAPAARRLTVINE